MVDVVWTVGMCLTMLVAAIMTFYFHKKNQAVLEAEEKERKERHDAALAASMIGGSAGRSLQLSREEVESNMDSLCRLFSQEAQPSHKMTTAAPKAPAEAPTPLAAAPPMMQPRPKPESPKKENEHIRSEIEQAVKETQ